MEIQYQRLTTATAVCLLAFGLSSADPVIKTVGPGKDYETLQSWWTNWASLQTNSAQWAECYSGGDLGGLVIDNGSGTPKANEYFRIYAHHNERHGGRTDTPCAYLKGKIEIGEQYTRIEGLRIDCSGETEGINQYDPISDFIADGNLIYSTNNTDYGIYLYGGPGAGSIVTNIIIRNNIVYGSNTMSYGIFITGANYLAGGHGVFQVYNNTIHDAADYGIMIEGQDAFEFFDDSDITIYATNNIITDSGTLDYYGDGYGIMTLSGGYNLSSDATGDDWGATGSLTGKTASAQFENPVSDWNIKTNSNVYNAGTTLSTFFWDSLRTPRPQFSTWDMGGIELEENLEGFQTIVN
jgi:hypothetical protein